MTDGDFPHGGKRNVLVLKRKEKRNDLRVKRQGGLYGLHHQGKNRTPYNYCYAKAKMEESEIKTSSHG